MTPRLIEVRKPADPVTLIIQFDPTTLNIALQGPLMNPILCNMILDGAREFVRRYDPEKQIVKSGIIP